MPAKTVDSKPGLALKVLRQSRSISYVLYDANKFKEFIQEMVKSEFYEGQTKSLIEDSINESILGYIKVSPYVGGAFGAKEVQESAAERGYGPLMYDIAMSQNKGLMADRNSVSDNAEKVWDRYMLRSDVTNLPLDDVEDPQTSTPDDDAELHAPIKTREKNKRNLKNNVSIDRAFFMKNGGPNVNGLITNDRHAVYFLQDGFDVSEEVFNDIVLENLTKFFRRTYDKRTA